MDRFYIGQRIRILHNAARPELDGRAARIVGRIVEVRRRNPHIGSEGDWLVAPESHDGTPPPRWSLAYVVASAELESFPPEGMARVEWIDCAWQPEVVRDVVEVPRNVRAQQRVLRALAKRFGR